jgi:hypothetical protein
VRRRKAARQLPIPRHARLLLLLELLLPLLALPRQVRPLRPLALPLPLLLRQV